MHRLAAAFALLVTVGPAPAEPAAERVAPAVERGVAFLLSSQEGEEKREWPYEGVYRVGGQIPVGYRIGGTAIAAEALLRSHGYAADEARRAAVAKATGFVCDALGDELMSPASYDGGYDVRGWGYTYALNFLLALKAAGAVPDEPAELAGRVDERIAWCVDAIQRTQIPTGGWNYARPRGVDAPAPASPFMTGPTLLALYEARRQGYAVDEVAVEGGLASLERGRSGTGAYVYSGPAGKAEEAPNGAVGRMLIAEIALHQAGRSDAARVRAAVDAFFEHWEWLDKRRAKPGTHAAPYGVAPYYFYYAHLYAARAIELLPEADRPALRERLADLIFRNRLEDGTWNDRVFARSASYGTAMVVLALLAPETPGPARWEWAD